MSDYATIVSNFWKMDQGFHSASHFVATEAKKALDVMIDAWFEQTLGPLPEPGSTIHLDKMPVDEAAVTFWRYVREACKEEGDVPSWETFCTPPEDTKVHQESAGAVWRVSWEAGPYNWAVGLSLAGVAQLGRYSIVHHNHNWFMEPYYSFDVCFAEI